MLRKIFIVSAIALLAFPLFLQVTKVSADVMPVTTPVTAPITTPITTPTMVFNLIGNITYKRLGAFFRAADRIIPAANVLITVEGFFNHSQHFTTTTDSSGNYNLLVPSGLYKISVKDPHATFFVPPFTVQNVKQNKQQRVNFQGLLFR